MKQFDEGAINSSFFASSGPHPDVYRGPAAVYNSTMSNAYETYRYLYPARPGGKPLAPMSIPMMEKLGYWAQKKKNGTCSVIFTHGKDVIFKQRYKDLDHAAWAPQPAHLEFFGSISSKWNVFCAELLHSKGPSVKHEFYIFDILVHEGVYLVGKTFAERMQILSDMFKKDWKDEGDQYRIHKHVTVAKTYSGGFKGLFDKPGPLDEGLVFKLPSGKLQPCVDENSNSTSMQKCRHPKSKTYSF